MIRALYRRRGGHEEREIQLPGDVIDCAAIDAAAERMIGTGWRRMASWLSTKPSAGMKAPVG